MNGEGGAHARAPPGVPLLLGQLAFSVTSSMTKLVCR